MLAYVHPLWQLAALALAAYVLALGLRLRGLRRRGRFAERARLVGRHARLGLVFVAALAVGLTGGPVTMAFVRHDPVLRSAHAFFAGLAVIPLAVGAILGWRLWRGRATPAARDLHVFCMGLGLLLALVTLMLGLDLLP